MDFGELIKSFGGKLGIELAIDDNGTCSLEVDGMDISIHCIDEAGRVCLYGEIGEPPPQGLEQLLGAMLDANYLFKATGGSTISRNPENGKFYLCRYDQFELLGVEGFFAVFETFANTLEKWRKMLEEYRPVAGNADATIDIGGFGSPFMQV